MLIELLLVHEAVVEGGIERQNACRFFLLPLLLLLLLLLMVSLFPPQRPSIVCKEVVAAGAGGPS